MPIGKPVRARSRAAIVSRRFVHLDCGRPTAPERSRCGGAGKVPARWGSLLQVARRGAPRHAPGDHPEAAPLEHSRRR